MDRTLEQRLDKLQEAIANLYAGIHELDESGKKQRHALIERLLEKERYKLSSAEQKAVEEHWKSLEPHSQLIASRRENSDESLPDVSMRLHERYKILKMLLKKK